MPKGWIEKSTLQATADAIRQKTGAPALLKPAQFAPAILGIQGGGDFSKYAALMPDFKTFAGVTINSGIANPTTKEINKPSEGIKTLPLGTLIRTTENGTVANYEIAGFDVHKAGCATLVRKYVQDTQYTTTTSYFGGALDTFCNTTLPARLPSQLQAALQSVSITAYTASGAQTQSRKGFSLSYTELGFGNNNGVAENAALPLYSTNTSRIKSYASGSAQWWWTRSLYSGSNPFYINTAGGYEMWYAATNAFCVANAFVISSELMYDPTPNTDGSYNLLFSSGGGSGISTDILLSTSSARPQNIRTTLRYAGTITNLYACNNYNDAAPKWEAITDGQDHAFTNTTKTASQWAVGVRAVIGGTNPNLAEFPALIETE